MNVPRILVALFAGMLFGLGLAVSGMMNPRKVIGFLDVAGDWDPTLMFVMGGALLVTIPAFRLILKRPRPILADGFALPKASALDARLLGGAALFGSGWGLSGFCPGSAVAALATGLTPVFAFVAAMLAGMALYRWIFERSDRGGPHLQDSSPPSSETEEVYFVDAWARRRNAARMKSFEKGHTITDPASGSFSGWGSPE